MDKYEKTVIIITSFDRKEMLLKLISQLNGYDIIIFDDHSNFKLKGDFIFHQFKKNYGKHRCWRKFQKIFDYINKYMSNYDYYILLPDDVELIENFVEKSIKTYEEITDKNKISLSLLTDVRCESVNWTDFPPIPFGNVLLTQWNDLCFISEKKFFKEVVIKEPDPFRWVLNPSVSSGVGAQISRQFYEKGFNQYHVKESFTISKPHESKMNNNESIFNQP